MVEPQKPFACTLPDCGMTFTNEDHLHVHTKKHDMQLQFGPEQKATFVADQTPTPTRFIRNCEEVGLFQDLQNVTVNPFDEGFKRAMETKQGILSLESAISSDDVLHTPQMVFPLIEGDSTLFSATNNQRNITISRSSSDESGTIKEYETTTISKLTNEVTTISRIIGNRDVLDKVTAEDASTVKNTDTVHNKDNVETVYKNNVIKIHSNVEIRKDSIENKAPVLIYTDSVIKDSSVTKDVLLTDSNKLQVPEKVPPIMSQKSLDFVVDSLTSELTSEAVIERDKQLTMNVPKNNNNLGIINIRTDIEATGTKINNNTPNIVKRGVRKNNVEPVKGMTESDDNCAKKIKIETKSSLEDDYEVIIKLPSGKHVRMKAVEETKPDPKEILRKNLANKLKQQTKLLAPLKPPIVPNVLQIPSGTLIPVTLVNHNINTISTSNLTNIPITNTLGNNILVPVTRINAPKVPISINPKRTDVITNVPPKITTVPTIKRVQIVRKIRSNVNISPDPLSNIKISQPFEVDQTGKRRISTEKAKNIITTNIEDDKNGSTGEEYIAESSRNHEEDDCIIEKVVMNPEVAKRTRNDLDSRCAASQRYRARLREAMKKQSEEIRELNNANQRLIAEKAVLKLLITEHMKRCPMADDLRITQERINRNSTEI